jgi:hypothetical protein
MDHSKTEMLFKGVEIAVTVQERMPSGDAESRDVTVDHFAHGVTALAEVSVVLGRGYRELFASGIEDDQPGEFFSHLGKYPVVADPLQNFAKDHVGYGKSLLSQHTVEPIHLRIFDGC